MRSDSAYPVSRNNRGVTLKRANRAGASPVPLREGVAYACLILSGLVRLCDCPGCDRGLWSVAASAQMVRIMRCGMRGWIDTHVQLLLSGRGVPLLRNASDPRGLGLPLSLLDARRCLPQRSDGPGTEPMLGMHGLGRARLLETASGGEFADSHSCEAEANWGPTPRMDGT